jgi:MoxR-like ATPase
VFAGAEYERLKAAASRFSAFFLELNDTFAERRDVLQQLALALLSREHVLMTGPPGTAKSRMSWAVLGRIVDERSGKPSVYARQFTESTVHTDLIGPIDFKTLMESGRTEHFTDEGMLGAVHAFLDEVFDGRDMLLRATLNVLHERELKQGTRITRGAIESAIMTTNRYLAEVLDGSREALLAFVDRIAHVSFVPKGFGDPANLAKVLRTHVAGTTPRPLLAPLTIQDLDVLQHAVDSVYIADETCDQLAAFARSFEVEMAAAIRADPTFVPTRYLSTRTLLRLARTLRAACVCDWAFNGQQRQFVATRDDFGSLRFTLLLSGPDPKQVEQLLQFESDPRERRQLEIVRGEREIFERCVRQLAPEAVSVVIPVIVDENPAEFMRGDVSRLGDQELYAAAAQLSVSANLSHAQGAHAAARLTEVLRELSRRALSAALDGSLEESAPLQTAERLAVMAAGVEGASPVQRPVAQWLRGQALQLVEQAISTTSPAMGAELEQWLREPPTPERAALLCRARIERMEQLLDMQTRLISNGATRRSPERTEALWQEALARLEDELVAIWDEAFRVAVERATASVGSQDLAATLEALDTPLRNMNAVGRSLAKLGADPAVLKKRVAGRRLAPTVQLAFERTETGDRADVAQRVEQVLNLLQRFGLEHAVAREQLLGWLASALLRDEPKIPDLAERSAPHFEGYRGLRQRIERRSLVFTLSEVAARVFPDLLERLESPEATLSGLKQLWSVLPEPTKKRVLDSDLGRVQASIRLLERWWAKLVAELDRDPETALHALAQSRFFHVTRDERALSRFALEAELVAALTGAPAVAPLLDRISKLERQSGAQLVKLLQHKSDAGWATLTRPQPPE